MFIVIKNDTINLNDISRLSRNTETITVFFISHNEPVSYIFDNENDATEVEFKVFKALEEHGFIV